VVVPASQAIPAAGPHETVDITSSTTKPNTSTGLGYAATYHGLSGPQSDPPALRRLVITLPAGARVDTSVPGQCTASDAELMLVGEGACPSSSRVGTGMATANVTGLGTMSLNTVLFNAKDQQLELVESGGHPAGVIHTYIHGTTLDGPVPTCLTGGQPPGGCPFDEVTLLANHLASIPISIGPRNYGTTPPTCPRSRRWSGQVTFYYADGSVDAVAVQQPCAVPVPSKRPTQVHRSKHRHRRRHHVATPA
jgi:hypothetical protein